MSKSESEIQSEIQISGAKHSCILMRNNSGQLNDEHGRPVRYGLNNVSKKHQETSASSDLIGITTVIVTQEMVGKTIGIFTAIEVKKEAWKPSEKDQREVAQNNFIRWVKLRGGIGLMTNSVAEFTKLFKA